MINGTNGNLAKQSLNAALASAVAPAQPISTQPAETQAAARKPAPGKSGDAAPATAAATSVPVSSFAKALHAEAGEPGPAHAQGEAQAADDKGAPTDAPVADGAALMPSLLSLFGLQAAPAPVAPAPAEPTPAAEDAPVAATSAEGAAQAQAKAAPTPETLAPAMSAPGAALTAAVAPIAVRAAAKPTPGTDAEPEVDATPSTTSARPGAQATLASALQARTDGAGLSGDGGGPSTSSHGQFAAQIQALLEKIQQPGAGAQGGDPSQGATTALPAAMELRAAAPAAIDGGALRLPNGDSTQWQSPLMQALGDRIQLQLAARSEQAVIRLEPPQMGHIDISVRQQAGGLQVQLSASHGEVVHQLQQIRDGMRWDLAQRHGGEVSVQVSASAQSGAGGAGRDGDRGQGSARQQQPESRIPGRALGDPDDANSTPFTLA